jgi:hypothetical protein
MEAKEYSMKKTYEQRRQELRAISQSVRKFVTEGAFSTINEAVIEIFYTKDGHSEFHTLYQWNKKGYRVLKGSTAFPVWGAPKEKNKAAASEPRPEENEENPENFWPICYLFSNLQVHRADENN